MSAKPIINANLFCYHGYYYDTKTGFYYLQSRNYDPTTGHLISADNPENLFITNGQLFGANFYAYCHGNPLMYTDPTWE